MFPDKSLVPAVLLTCVWIIQTLLRPLLVEPYTWQWGVAVILSGLIAGLTGVCYHQWWTHR